MQANSPGIGVFCLFFELEILYFFQLFFSLYDFKEADLLLFHHFRKNLRFGEAECALMQ